jgi:hypothetical protein
VWVAIVGGGEFQKNQAQTGLTREHQIKIKIKTAL